MSTPNEPSKLALSSSFSPRPSTGVPPATQTFEPLVRSVLGHRFLYNTFAYSITFFLASTVLLPTGDNASSVLRLLRPVSWLIALLAWLVGIAPVLVARKAFLEPISSPASSPSKTIAGALAKPTIRRWIGVYVTTSLSLLSLEFSRVWSMSDEMHLSVFIKSRKHPYYLNGRFIFLVLAQVWLAISFALRNVMLERLVFRWAKARPSSNAPFMPRNLATLFLTVFLFTLSSFVAFNIAFGLARLILLPVLLRVPFVRLLLKPFVGHFIRGPWTLSLPLRHLSLEMYAFTLGIFMIANWEFAESLFDVYIPQPFKVATAADPNVVLVSGITSTNPLYLYFSYSELRDVALDAHPSSASRRTALFSDQKFSLGLWSTLARESLLQLGHDYQTLLRKGGPIMPVDAPTPTVAPKTTPPPATPLLRKAILKAPQQSPMSRVLDTLGSDAGLSETVGAAASEAGAHVPVDASIPELFRSTSIALVTSARPSTTTAAPGPPKPTALDAYVACAKAQCRDWVVKHSPAWCQEVAENWNQWWRRDRINKLVEKSLPNRDLDALIIQVLAGLVCASLAEDRYGIVQRDIPRILEAFLSFLTALEEYQVEVTNRYVPPTPDEVMQGEQRVLDDKERTRVEVAKASEVIGIVVDALKSGVGDIVQTFGEKLVAFKFPPRIAHKLQTFVDYP